jgi:predicted TIM-barrel fold metal-dependent hydrolase
MSHSPRMSLSIRASAWLLIACLVATRAWAQTAPSGYELNDSHFHLTNYVQEGTEIHQFLQIMGNKVGRVALFGIPLQQTWSYSNSADYAPTYYLQSDAPLYYYSFTDAYIAMTYRSLAPAQQARFDPMITGFNPADMYAADHIKRVLRTFPGVFTGIGEFTIHKEFVSSKVAGETASLTNPALDRILQLAGEAGLVVILHNDIDMPFAKTDAPPVYLQQMKELLRRHPDTTIIWAHMGLGRVVHPVQASASASATERAPGQMSQIVGDIVHDPAFKHVYFDISWDEVAKYILADPQITQNAARFLNEYPDRFLFGTDEVAPKNQEQYLKVYYMYDPLWKLLSPEARDKVKKLNYERLFDAARLKVRAWEKSNLKPQ